MRAYRRMVMATSGQCHSRRSTPRWQRPRLQYAWQLSWAKHSPRESRFGLPLPLRQSPARATHEQMSYRVALWHDILQRVSNSCCIHLRFLLPHSRWPRQPPDGPFR